MRIAQIVASLESRHGGPSRSVRGLAAGFGANGHDVELLSTVPGAGEPVRTGGGVTTRLFPREWPQTFTPSKPLRQLLTATSFDVVHHHGLWLRTFHYARLAACKSSAPLVVSPRGMMSPWAWQHNRWKKILASWLIHPGALSAVQGWHATSEAEAAEIGELGFTQPVCVAPNGVVAPEADTTSEALAYWQRNCPALASRPVALFYSRFHPKKRVLELIDLWLSTAPADWLLLLVGIPEAYTVDDIKQYVQAAGGGQRIMVFDGTDAPAPYAAASLFLLPSHSENFGLVVAEALVNGLPALATDATPWKFLDTTGAGHCVPWADFGVALRALLAEGPEALRARGRQARDLAIKEFAWDKSARTLASFYERLRVTR